MDEWWYRNVVEPGKLPLLVCLVAFVITFLVTRSITRLIRSGRGPFHDVSRGEVHVHHMVPGVFILMIGAVAAIGAPAQSPWRELAALAIGIGASLVLDEFALMLHLEDVYWASEGRISVQTVAIAAVFLAGTLVGLTPFGVDDMGDAELGLRVWAIVALLVAVLAVAVCFAKGKYRTGLVGVLLPVVAYIGAIRLARPGSLWFRRYYRGERRRQRSNERAAAFDARWSPLLRRASGFLTGLG
ncbi:MAG TPA: hypothetical protein VGJ86_24420 [Acidimicrobiales bacterium]|jgi:type IV secretory pathway TrbD component